MEASAESPPKDSHREKVLLICYQAFSGQPGRLKAATRSGAASL